MYIALQPSQLYIRLFLQVILEPNVLVHRVVLISVFVKVNPHSLELLSLDVANKAVVHVVLWNLFLLSPHVCKRVDDYTRNDRGDYQVYKKYINEVENFIRHRNGSQVIPLSSSNRRASKPVVNVHSEAVQKSIAVHSVFKSVLVPDIFIHESSNRIPIGYDHKQQQSRYHFIELGEHWLQHWLHRGVLSNYQNQSELHPNRIGDNSKDGNKNKTNFI